MLTESAENWVMSIFESMTTEEKVAQLLHPEDRGYSIDDWEDILRKVPVGSIFAAYRDANETEAMNRFLQSRAGKAPILISADMEHGACMFKNKATFFPYAMALGACDSPEMAYKMGKITARESRSHGIHWSFSPVVDLNLNPNNPVTNIRSVGDNPAKTIPILTALVRGLQEDNLIAATCKHFPGDGVDDRDQHMVTSVNSLPFDQYMDLYGKVWNAVIHDAGTKTIMDGHIALPDFQGCRDDVDAALPATLSRKLQIELLRDVFQFQGVLVSDAYPMTGFTSRYPAEELAWRSIQNGCDSALFCHPIKDFERLMQALREGKLSEERVNESCLRILRLKASLNLQDDCFGTPFTPDEMAGNQAFADSVAEQAVTQIRSCPGLLPLDPKKTRKVLTVTLERTDSAYDSIELETVDAELKARGIQVDHLKNPDHNALLDALDAYDAIFVNMSTFSHAGLQLRLTGKAASIFWRSFFAQGRGKVIFTSFGSPYMLYELPAISNLICVWGKEKVSQKAAVRAWFGEIPMEGKLPVRLQTCTVRRWNFN